jgi:hypothetical protein
MYKNENNVEGNNVAGLNAERSIVWLKSALQESFIGQGACDLVENQNQMNWEYIKKKGIT